MKSGGKSGVGDGGEVVCDVSRLQQAERLRVDVPAGLQLLNSPLSPRSICSESHVVGSFIDTCRTLVHVARHRQQAEVRLLSALGVG